MRVVHLPWLPRFGDGYDVRDKGGDHRKGERSKTRLEEQLQADRQTGRGETMAGQGRSCGFLVATFFFGQLFLVSSETETLFDGKTENKTLLISKIK